MSDNTGGPAFPQSNDRVVAARSIADSQGMSMRDYFAAKAMQGAVAGMANRGETFMYLECAALAYEMADAMLKAREAK